MLESPCSLFQPFSLTFHKHDKNAEILPRRREKKTLLEVGLYLAAASHIPRFWPNQGLNELLYMNEHFCGNLWTYCHIDPYILLLSVSGSGGPEWCPVQRTNEGDGLYF